MSYLEELLPEFRKGYVLGEVKGNKFHFVTPDGKTYKFCRPVRKDEVNFYEDKKDEQD